MSTEDRWSSESRVPAPNATTIGGHGPVVPKSSANKRKMTGAHFTPPELARFLAERLLAEAKKHNLTHPRVLDPSCGDGELLMAFAQSAGEELKGVALVGVEEDAKSVADAMQRLKAHSVAQVDLVRGDFLKMLCARMGNRSLFEEHVLPDALLETADIIIANPPYVRTQHLGAARAQELAETFGLQGRVDLYHAFMVAMTHQLAPGGLLGVITSNRFLTTKAGSSIRELLTREYDVLEVLDLGDTKLFEAAVLPAIVLARRRGERLGKRDNPVSFVRIYEHTNASENRIACPDEADSVYQILDNPSTGMFRVGGRTYSVAVGTLPTSTLSKEPWVMATGSENAWLNQLLSGASCRLGDLVKVRVGIKTTADSVFIRTDWGELPEEVRPEEDLLKPLLSHDDAVRWRMGKSCQRKILYPYENVRGRRTLVDLKRYPRTEAYLNLYRDRLEGRRYVQEAGRAWFEIWVPQDPALWPLPKVAFPDISQEPKFLYDDAGNLVDGNCYWCTSPQGTEDDILFLIMALANSKVMTQYHRLAFQNRLYAGRMRYLTQYVEQYPIPDPHSPQARRLIAVAKRLVFECLRPEEERELEREVDGLVASAFGVRLETCGA